MPTLIIRNIQEDDLPAIMEIEKISFTSPWSEQEFLNEMYKKNALLKVAVFEGNIIGYICVTHRLHESHILNLAVHPDFRRQGVATILMAEVTKELKKGGCAFMHLKVRVSNTGTHRFYELIGFTVESTRKKYYDNPDEDALLMIRRL
jgi:ribosomal-protein-alanine N-acetyltransferase